VGGFPFGILLLRLPHLLILLFLQALLWLLSQNVRCALFHRSVLWQFSLLSLYFYLINFIVLLGQRLSKQACNLPQNVASLSVCRSDFIPLTPSCLRLPLPTCKALPVVACPNRRRFSTLTMTYCRYPTRRHSQRQTQTQRQSQAKTGQHRAGDRGLRTKDSVLRTRPGHASQHRLISSSLAILFAKWPFLFLFVLCVWGLQY